MMMMRLTTGLALLCLAACSEVELEPYVYGDVDPAFTAALEAYESWDNSCAQGDAAHEAAIAGGVKLMKLDALLCHHSRLTAAQAKSPPTRKERERLAELTGLLYGVTGDQKWWTREYCDIVRYRRVELKYSVRNRNNFAALAPTSQATRTRPGFSDNISAFFECDGDYEPIDFKAEEISDERGNKFD